MQTKEEILDKLAGGYVVEFSRNTALKAMDIYNQTLLDEVNRLNALLQQYEGS